MRHLVLVALLLTPACCVSKTELRADVAAWRAFTDAVEPDLQRLYGAMPETSRRNRLALLEENRAAITKAEERAGIAAPGSGS